MADFKGSLGSAINTGRAWRVAAVVFGVVSIGLTMSLFRQASNHQTILIPYGLISANKSVSVTGKTELDGEYLSLIARADLSSLLDWQPASVNRQTHQFLTRLSPEAYAQFNISLTNDAAKYAAGNVSEAFFPQTIEFFPPHKVVVSGLLKRWSGDEQTLKSSVTYTLDYEQAVTGIYAISKLEVK